ncbi:small ribosomal subunit protein S13, mitochondrial isoform X2 [Morus notabilis]|uniref:small ribosomal subunit protein S13, mitochondrial isoform X2 n=1 Tax=Morus notabilis TaxID=981085 RepID=UPI000CED2EB8|nr:small ribosomal subunit protein S13, mitochondrial isoform X2 [Morus notabilis]
MLGLRASATTIISNVRLQIHQSLSIRCQRTQGMFVKAGMEIPDDKRLECALQYIHGIGRARARQILSDLSLVNKHVKDLTKREVYVLGEELSKGVTLRET